MHIYWVATKQQETQETWVLSLGLEDALEKEMATHSNTLAWEIPWRSLVGYNLRGHKESDTTESTLNYNNYMQTLLCYLNCKSLSHVMLFKTEQVNTIKY